MKRILWVLLVPAWMAGEETEKIKRVFQYGTYGEQVEALRSIQEQFSDEEKRKVYLPLLEMVINGGARESIQVCMEVVALIESKQLEDYYPVYEQILSNELLEKNVLDQEATTLVSAVLNAMIVSSNRAYGKYMLDHISSENIYANDPAVRKKAIEGIGALSVPNSEDRLIELYDKEERAGIKEIILHSLARYRREEDVAFYEAVIDDEGATSILKWISVVSLKNYPDSEHAYRILNRCYVQKNIEIRSRAVYALSFMKREEIKPFLMRASRNDSPRIRYQSIVGLRRFKGEDVNELLMYKMENDPDKSVRDEARRLLQEREIIEE